MSRRSGADFRRGVAGGRGQVAAAAVVDTADGPGRSTSDGVALAVVDDHHVLELHIHVDEPARVEIAEGWQDVSNRSMSAIAQ